MLYNWGLQGGTLTEDLEIAFTLPFKKEDCLEEKI